MKKLALLIYGLLIFTTGADCGVITTLSGFMTEERKPDAYYSLNTAGQNVRIYEFSPKSQPNHTCVIVFTESDTKSPTMSCFEKTDKAK